MHYKILLATALLLSSCAPKRVPAPAAGAPEPVELPGAADGINFDDLGWSASLSRVLVPAGRSGRLDLVDPKTGAITSIGGFSSSLTYDESRGIGPTSADSAPGWLVATDRGRKTLDVLDAEKLRIVSETALAAGPDYVRLVPTRREVWVTEPSAKQIEVFSLSSAGAPSHAGVILVAGGPESLVIDAARDRAWTHTWQGTTLGISLATRATVETWPNGCRGSRGIALDEANHFLMAGCDEGRAVVLGPKGEAIASYSDGAGVDIIAFDPVRRMLYLPGGDSATMALFGVGSKGALTFMGHVETAHDAHCVTVDGLGNAWVCDPGKGRLLKFAPR